MSEIPASARAAAVVTLVYAAGFGLPAIPVAVFVHRHGRLPWLGDLFPMYGGPWSETWGPKALAASLCGLFGVSLVLAWGSLRLWRGSRSGAVVCLVLIPVEAVFWYGYALPIPPVAGVARVALIAAAWRRLRPRKSSSS
jgi:hypothetical protein